MKSNKALVFTRVLYVLFAVGTIVSLFIVYKNVDGKIAFRFLMGYLFFSSFMLLYVFSVTIFNLRKFKWVEIKRVLMKFITLFILFGALNYGFDYLFRPSRIDLFREFSIALGLSFGISFIDATFLKNKNEI